VFKYVMDDGEPTFPFVVVENASIGGVHMKVSATAGVVPVAGYSRG
jgi:hypothetical protein